MAINAVQGKDVVLMFRLLENQADEKATRLMLQTEHSTSETVDSESVATKDGTIQTGGSYEEEVSFSTVHNRGDEVLEELKEAMRHSKVVQMWEIDTGEEVEKGQYQAEYREGIITSLDTSKPVDDVVTNDFTFNTNQMSQTGAVELDKEVIEALQYEFKNLDEYIKEI